MQPEDIDLDELARVVGESPPEHRVGYVRGKTALRDLVARHLECSAVLAEQLVDTMVLRGLVEYVGDDERPGLWRCTTS